MTWIRTIPLTEADEKLRRAVEAQKALYPKEYATPVHPTPPPRGPAPRGVPRTGHPPYHVDRVVVKLHKWSGRCGGGGARIGSPQGCPSLPRGRVPVLRPAHPRRPDPPRATSQVRQVRQADPARPSDRGVRRDLRPGDGRYDSSGRRGLLRGLVRAVQDHGAAAG